MAKVEKTIVTPAGYAQPLWVKGDTVSNSYRDEIGKYIADLLLTYHSKNAEIQFTQALNYAHPSQHSILSARFKSDADRIKRNQLSNVFYRMHSHVMADSIVLTGEEVRMVGSQVVGRETKKYKLELEYSNGKMWLGGFYEVEQDATTGLYTKVGVMDSANAGGK